jgi:hypothetical protein
MSVGQKYWNEERCDVLRHLWAEQWTAVEIAEALNEMFPGYTVTRNAVVGKVHRLRLPMHQPGWGGSLSRRAA